MFFISALVVHTFKSLIINYLNMWSTAIPIKIGYIISATL